MRAEEDCAGRATIVDCAASSETTLRSNGLLSRLTISADAEVHQKMTTNRQNRSCIAKSNAFYLADNSIDPRNARARLAIFGRDACSVVRYLYQRQTDVGRLDS